MQFATAVLLVNFGHTLSVGLLVRLWPYRPHQRRRPWWVSDWVVDVLSGSSWWRWSQVVTGSESWTRRRGRQTDRSVIRRRRTSTLFVYHVRRLPTLRHRYHLQLSLSLSLGLSLVCTSRMAVMYAETSVKYQGLLEAAWMVLRYCQMARGWATNKNNPLAKILYLGNCRRFFYEICGMSVDPYQVF